MSALDKDLIEQVQEDFDESEQVAVMDLLLSITLQHVMAESEYNLRNTRFSVLELAEGDLEECKRYVERAKIDFRDVIYWVTLNNKSSKD